MPLDHYVSRVHLRRFYDPILGRKMHAIRKSDLLYFPPAAEDVCRIPDGSSNRYLREERIIEEFLKDIEPRYNGAVTELSEGRISAQTIYVIAGFVAYISVCSPTAMRLNSEPLKVIVDETGRRLDRAGKLPPPPPVLGATSFSELIDSGLIDTVIDEKYPQAIGISSILGLLKRFGNCHWEILINDHTNSPYFSSDYPLAIESTARPEILNTIVPLSPDLAIRIHPNLDQPDTGDPYDFSGFRWKISRPPKSEIIEINRMIVMCAEENVFFAKRLDWTTGFIAKHRYFKLESVTHRIPSDGGAYILSTRRIQESKPQDA